jgi:cysteine-rich repeat protein
MGRKRSQRTLYFIATLWGVALVLWGALLSQGCVFDSPRTVHCGGDLYCPQGSSCAAKQSVCISNGCGDGVLNRGAGEVCDDGNITDGDGCSGDCRILEDCGDGNLDPGEICDDGNGMSGDGCSGDCLSTEICGNGYRDINENCDDGNTESGDGCSADCVNLENCGDGARDPGEECDDGNTEFGDGCSGYCSLEICGDGRAVAEIGEECDTQGNSSECDADCTLPECNDGLWNPLYVNPDSGFTEQCDEGGNTISCDNDCTRPECGDGVHNPQAVVAGFSHTEECDEGAMNDDEAADACRSDCRLARCGDAAIDTGESCDGGDSDGDGLADMTISCDDDCTWPGCGDLLVNPYNNTATPGASDGEECDSGGVDTALCDFNCTLARCGDGYINAASGEACDGSQGCVSPLHCSADCTRCE